MCHFERQIYGVFVLFYPQNENMSANLQIKKIRATTVSFGSVAAGAIAEKTVDISSYGFTKAPWILDARHPWGGVVEYAEVTKDSITFSVTNLSAATRAISVYLLLAEIS